MGDDESSFLAAIARDPADTLNRLVYADWLDERDDPRGEYLRLLCAVAGWQELSADRDGVIDRLQRLGAGFDSIWKSAVQRGANWRTLFDANVPPTDRREHGAEYHFDPPATAEQLAGAELALGVPLPLDVRAMWSEFNGVRYTTRMDRQHGREPGWYFLDLGGVLVDTTIWGQEYRWEEIFDEEYGAGTFKKLVLIHHDGAFATHWALCSDEVAGHPAGTVVFHDHDSPELPALAANLTDLVCRRFTERFSHW